MGEEAVVAPAHFISYYGYRPAALLLDPSHGGAKLPGKAALSWLTRKEPPIGGAVYYVALLTPTPPDSCHGFNWILLDSVGFTVCSWVHRGFTWVHFGFIWVHLGFNTVSICCHDSFWYVFEPIWAPYTSVKPW